MTDIQSELNFSLYTEYFYSYVHFVLMKYICIYNKIQFQDWRKLYLTTVKNNRQCMDAQYTYKWNM
jgi:hypothetical protein